MGKVGVHSTPLKEAEMLPDFSVNGLSTDMAGCSKSWLANSFP